MKKILFYVIIILNLLPVGLKAQYVTFASAHKLGGSAIQSGRAIAIDNSGNVYTTGYFTGTIDLDPGPGVYNINSIIGDDVFISKLDASGNFVWGKGIIGNGTNQGLAITLDSSANVYITGFFSGTADFDPGVGVYTITVAGLEDVFVTKLDSAGNFVWAKTMGGSQYDRGVGIAIDDSSNVLIAGRYALSGDFDPGPGTFSLSGGYMNTFVSKLDASGNFIWAKSLTANSGQCNANAIATDDSGSVYITGSFFNGITDFDPGPGTYTLVAPANSTRIYISKLDATGNFVWAKKLAETADGNSYAIKVDGSNNVYTTGFFYGSLPTDFDPGPGTYTLFSNLGSSDVFISKLDINGNFVWAKNVVNGGGPARGYGMTFDSFGDVCITGIYGGINDFDPGPGTFYLSTGTMDIFIMAVDSLGNFLWAKGISAPAYDDAGFGIATYAGNVFSVGQFEYVCDFDPGPSTFTIQSTGIDAYVHKMSPCSGPTAGPISGVTVSCEGNVNSYSIALLPGTNTYSWNLPGGWTGTSSTNTINTTCGSSGVLTITAINDICGPGSPQILNVTINPLPAISVNSGLICSGQSFTLIPSGAATYTIQGGSTVVSPTTNTTYSVMGTSTAGCVSNTPAISSITVNATPQLTLTSTPTLICIGQSATLTANGATSYTWNPGGNISSQIVVSPTVSSNYTTTGETNGCSNTSTLTLLVDLCTGMEDLRSKQNILIHPNPSNGNFHLVFSAVAEDLNVYVYNIIGEQVFCKAIEEKETDFNLTDLPNGIYILQVLKMNEEVYRAKIIKQ